MAKATLNFIWRYPTVALLAFSCFGVAATASPTSGAESVNGIAAIVNDKVITYSEVREVVEPRERLLRSQYSGQELVNKITELRKAALQDLIDRQLIVQAFDKEKLAIPPHLRRRAGGRGDQEQLRWRPSRLHQDDGGAKIYDVEIPRSGAAKDHRAGDAGQERDVEPDHPAGQGGGILPQAQGPVSRTRRRSNCG